MLVGICGFTKTTEFNTSSHESKMVHQSQSKLMKAFLPTYNITVNGIQIKRENLYLITINISTGDIDSIVKMQI